MTDTPRPWNREEEDEQREREQRLAEKIQALCVTIQNRKEELWPDEDVLITLVIAGQHREEVLKQELGLAASEFPTWLASTSVNGLSEVSQKQMLIQAIERMSVRDPRSRCVDFVGDITGKTTVKRREGG